MSLDKKTCNSTVAIVELFICYHVFSSIYFPLIFFLVHHVAIIFMTRYLIIDNTLSLLNWFNELIGRAIETFVMLEITFTAGNSLAVLTSIYPLVNKYVIA